MGKIPQKQTALTPITEQNKANWNNHSNRFAVATPQIGQLMKYNANTQKWEGRSSYPPVSCLVSSLQYEGSTNTNGTIIHARSQFLGLDNQAADLTILYVSSPWLSVEVNANELRIQYSNRPENEGLGFFVLRLKNQDGESEDFRYNLNFQAVSTTWAARRVAVDLDTQAAVSWAARRVAVDDTSINLPASTGVAVKSLMADNWGSYPNVTWSDGVDYRNMRMWRWTARPVPAPNLTVVSVPKIKAMIDYWTDTHGGNVVTLPVAWDEVQIGQNQFEFRPLRWILDYARSKGVKLILKFYATRRFVEGSVVNHPIYGTPAEGKNPFDTTAPWAFEVGDVAQDANGNPVATDIFHNTIDFWSPKITNLENYLAAVSTVLHDYEDVIEYTNVITHKSQEMQFDFDLLSSYHPATIAAWNDFYQQRFNAPAPAAPTSFSGLVGKRWLAFKTYTLREFSKRCALRLKLHANVKYIIESGSFSDALLNRGNLGITAHAAEDTWLDGYKQNPGYRANPNDLSYHDPHWSAEMMVSTGKYSVIEWTNAENIPMNTLADNVKTAIDLGVKSLSFAFFELAYQDADVHAKLSQVVNALKASGHWTKTYPAARNNPDTILASASYAIANNGLEKAYINEFNNSRNAHGGHTPKIVVINDLSALD